MIVGTHLIVLSHDPEADRSFFKNVLGFDSVDAGHGWLIFALPPSEAAIHPASNSLGHELYFMSDDLSTEIQALQEQGVACSTVEEAQWGLATTIRLPGGSDVGLYQPRHPSPVMPGLG